MVMTAWAFIVLRANTPQHARETVLMRVDNMPAVFGLIIVVGETKRILARSRGYWGA